jgi:uncharacterized protein DUF2213
MLDAPMPPESLPTSKNHNPFKMAGVDMRSDQGRRFRDIVASVIAEHGPDLDPVKVRELAGLKLSVEITQALAPMGGLAFDRAMLSARSYDRDGRLRVDLAVISQANVGKYWGNGIPDADKIGLDPNKTYRLYRPPAELAKAVPSVNGLPLLSSHQPVDSVQFRPDLLIGATLNDARFEAPHLLCSLAIWSAEAIKDIESGAKGALSAGYHYDPDMRPGTTPDGARFDGVMRDLVFMHPGPSGTRRTIGEAGITCINLKSSVTTKVGCVLVPRS